MLFEALFGCHVEGAIFKQFAFPVLPAWSLEWLIVLCHCEAGFIINRPQEAVSTHLRKRETDTAGLLLEREMNCANRPGMMQVLRIKIAITAVTRESACLPRISSQPLMKSRGVMNGDVAWMRQRMSKSGWLLAKSRSADSVDAVAVAVAGSRRCTLAPHLVATDAMTSSSVDTYLKTRIAATVLVRAR